MDCGFVINLDISSAEQTENAHITNTKAEGVVVLFPPKKSWRLTNLLQPVRHVCERYDMYVKGDNTNPAVGANADARFDLC